MSLVLFSFAASFCAKCTSAEAQGAAIFPINVPDVKFSNPDPDFFTHYFIKIKNLMKTNPKIDSLNGISVKTKQVLTK